MDLARLQPRNADAWLAPLALGLIMLIAQGLGPAGIEALRYDRDGILSGEAWRLVTGHLVHADFAHLGWNLAGLLLVTWLFNADERGKDRMIIIAASTAAIDLGFLGLEPRLEWYVGFSGVLHGLMAAGLLCWLVRYRDAITTLVSVLFVAKLAWEQAAGPLPFTAGTLDLPVIVAAHTYGALGGVAAGAWVLWRQRHVATTPPV